MVSGAHWPTQCSTRSRSARGAVGRAARRTLRAVCSAQSSACIRMTSLTTHGSGSRTSQTQSRGRGWGWAPGQPRTAPSRPPSACPSTGRRNVLRDDRQTRSNARQVDARTFRPVCASAKGSCVSLEGVKLQDHGRTAVAVASAGRGSALARAGTGRGALRFGVRLLLVSALADAMLCGARARQLRSTCVPLQLAFRAICVDVAS